jgi:hypothetical protein
MSYSIASLLVHDSNVPATARAALIAAHTGPAEQRRKLLEVAARILQNEVGVEAPDARELVGLGGDCVH